jgi:outer membrane protein assembly factor BamB
MRISNPIHSIALLTLSILPSTFAIFADEAYHIDYQHQLLGLPQPQSTFFHRPRKDERASLLYTLSDQGILGAVNPGTGAIVWRQLLATNASGTFGGDARVQGFLRAAEGEKIVVSAVDGRVNAWDAMTGREVWNNEFEGATKDLEVLETAGEEVHKDALVLFEHAGKGVLRRLNGENGDVVWEYALEGADVPFQVSTNVKNVFVVSLHGARGGYNLKITSLDPVTAKKLDDYTLSSKSDVHGPEDVVFVGANMAAPIIAWADKSLKGLNVNILGTKQIRNLNLASAGEDVNKVVIHAPHLVQSQPHFLVHSQSSTSHWAEVYHIDIAAGTITEAYHLPKLPGKGSFTTSSSDANVYFTRHTQDEVIIVASISHGVLGRWPLKIEEGAGHVVHGVSEVVSKSANTYVVRSAVLTSVENWDMIRNGVPAWRRVEGLTGAVAAAWAEIPEAEDLAKTLEAEAHSSPLAAYIHRVNRHLNDLQYIPGWLQNLPTRFLSSILPGDSTKAQDGPLVRDSFGFRKLVIVATERERVYALDTGNRGKVVWSRKAFDGFPTGKKWDVRGIFVNNTMGVVTIVSAEGRAIALKTATGAITVTELPDSDTPIQSIAMVDSPFGQQLVSIGVGGIPIHYSKEMAPKDGIVVRGASGEVKGLTFSIENGKTVHSEAWIFQPAVGERILSVTARPAHDPIASIGRVLSDRTVLYKYLNPNIVLVATVSEAASTASFYLLDSVSGEVLYSATHDSVDTTQPITSLLTENWFVYSLWGDVATDSTSFPAAKGYQLVVSELFESSLSNDRGPLGASANFSSLKPSDTPSDEPALPHVITQTFIIPEAISHMAVTQTRQGITTRQLLGTLASSNSIVAIPRNLIDPRRPVGRDPTPGDMEEGLIKYSPVLEFDPKMTITHKREVMGIKNVITSQALLESTSLVFAYGVDVFGTKLTPSLAFDILGKDFNRLALVATVTALTIGVGVLAPMVSDLVNEDSRVSLTYFQVRNKQINARWKTS